ncbi:hypothetical protein ACHAWF_012610 [Thalassiosira exigua]
MIRDSMDGQLHRRLLEEHMFSCSETELNDISELDNRVKVPVYIFEGYYHSLPSNEAVYSKNPNPMIGKDFMKPAASPLLRAFFEAFRAVNSQIFDKLKQDLLQASSFDDSSDSIEENSANPKDVCYLFAEWIDRGLHFGDLSIQIHYGQGNEKKLKSGVAWHNDAENSLLHLAVTLRGNRVLHSKKVQSHLNGITSNLRHLNNQPAEILEPQRPGDVYLSSSILMRHAPQFFQSEYSTRVIAIHARFLYTSAEVNHFRAVRTNDSWRKLTNVLAKNLASAHLKVPNLAQVESQLSSIS